MEKAVIAATDAIKVPMQVSNIQKDIKNTDKNDGAPQEANNAGGSDDNHKPMTD